jgi:hypothetical protein
LKSTGAVPRPILASMVVMDVVWRRLPFTSTSTWSGLNPRSCAGRTRSAEPEFDWRDRLNDGTSTCNVCASSPPKAPAPAICCASTTSTGTVVSSGDSARPLVAVTTTSSDSSPGDSCATTGTVAAMARAPNAVAGANVIRMMTSFGSGEHKGCVQAGREN